MLGLAGRCRYVRWRTDSLVASLQVQAAYNGTDMFFHYRWPAKQASIYHDMLKFEAGKWVRHGASVVGPHTEGIYEDRVSMMVDDGGVPEFARYGGYFLDLWHWRAHRGNPVNASDDEYVFDARSGDAGKGAFTTNWDAEKKQPKFMLDPEKTQRRALNWDDLAQRKLGFDDVYYITDDTAVPFDPDYAWKDGDTIPRRLLLRSRGDGSHADIKVVGNARWKDGFWDVTLTRAMDTGNPLDDGNPGHFAACVFRRCAGAVVNQCGTACRAGSWPAWPCWAARCWASPGPSVATCRSFFTSLPSPPARHPCWLRPALPARR